MFKSGLIVALFTLLSRISGLVRELLIASMFGSSWIADCINVSFKLPNLLRRIFGEGALSFVFVPIFSSEILKSKEKALEFSAKILTILTIILIFIIILMQLFMPQVTYILAPGFYNNPEKYKLVIELCRITTPYLALVCIVAVLGGMLNAQGHFSAFASSPIIMNLCVVFATIIMYQNKIITTHHAIAISLIIGGILQLIFMLIAIRRANMYVYFSFDVKDTKIKKFLTNMLPSVSTAGAQQLNLFITQSIASFIPGGISILAYAERLYQFPLALIGASFSTILLPTLSKLCKDNIKDADKLQNNAITLGIGISAPASLGLILLARPIVQLIYERGVFNATNTIDVSNTLIAFCLGLPSFVLAKILTTTFYAKHNTKTPFKISLIYIIFNILLNLLFIKHFGAVGIALGTSIASWINLIMLYRSSQSHNKFYITSQTIKNITKIIFATIIMSIFTYIMHYKIFEKYLYSDKIFIQSGSIAIVILSSMIIYLSCIFMFGLHKNIIHKKTST